MKYFVYWDKGSCNDGDHSSGMEAFDTIEEAVDKVKEVRSYNFSDYWDEVRIIEGTEIYPLPKEKS